MSALPVSVPSTFLYQAPDLILSQACLDTDWGSSRNPPAALGREANKISLATSLGSSAGRSVCLITFLLVKSIMDSCLEPVRRELQQANMERSVPIKRLQIAGTQAFLQHQCGRTTGTQTGCRPPGIPAQPCGNGTAQWKVAETWSRDSGRGFSCDLAELKEETKQELIRLVVKIQEFSRSN